MALHSARSSTYFPAAEMPSAKVSPSGVTGTFIKKLMLGRYRAYADYHHADRRRGNYPGSCACSVCRGRSGRCCSLGAGAAEGIVPPAGIGHDGHQWTAKVGIEHAAGGEVGVTGGGSVRCAS